MSGFIENPSAWDCSIWRCLCISQSPAGRADTEYLARDEASILVLFVQVQTSINSLDRRWIERWSSIRNLTLHSTDKLGRVVIVEVFLAHGTHKFVSTRVTTRHVKREATAMVITRVIDGAQLAI